MTDTPERDREIERKSGAIDLVIVPRLSDIGGLQVRRALPNVRRRMVGPFIFLDHMGPVEFRSGDGLDVRPHPHIGLATVTYLLDGEIVHRDSLGSVARIKPGELNWMNAGRGIVHSECTGPEARAAGPRLHGLQCWVALPLAQEESEPFFVHHDGSVLPVVSGEGKRVRIIAGEVYGERSPVATFWDTLFVDAELEEGAALPIDVDHEERAAYLISGEIDIAGDRFGPGRLLVFRTGDRMTIKALSQCRVALVGGAAMDGPRHIWWNLVASTPERIEEAKAAWKQGLFPRVPGETEFIPLPEH